MRSEKLGIEEERKQQRMNMNLERTEERAKVLRSMIEVLNTALEGQSELSTETLACYTSELLTLANEITGILEQNRG